MTSVQRGLPRRWTVGDVMTAHVHVASPNTPFKLLVRLIEENKISAVPIVDHSGVPIGVVSESDLLQKELRTDIESGSKLLHLRRRRVRRAKAEALFAADLMTSPPLCVHTVTPIAQAARVMDEHNVRRLVVTDDRGRIAGVVTRSDLLQVFLRTDDDIRSEIVDNLIPALLLDLEAPLQVDVRQNVVTLAGRVDRRSDVEILGRIVRDMDGVVDVVNRLRHRWDDTGAVPMAPLAPAPVSR